RPTGCVTLEMIRDGLANVLHVTGRPAETQPNSRAAEISFSLRCTLPVLPRPAASVALRRGKFSSRAPSKPHQPAMRRARDCLPRHKGELARFREPHCPGLPRPPPFRRRSTRPTGLSRAEARTFPPLLGVRRPARLCPAEDT